MRRGLSVECRKDNLLDVESGVWRDDVLDVDYRGVDVLGMECASHRVCGMLCNVRIHHVSSSSFLALPV